jgi:ABC-type polysaccharide/polyol phosphate transport system ATPase subunit
VLLVSHDPRPLTAFCDRALLLENGRITRSASGPEIFEAYRQLTQGA